MGNVRFASVIAFAESVIASAALSEAWVALASRETITRSDSVSFLCPYGYATPSQITATTKHQTPISANLLSLGDPSSAQWASPSKSARNAKKIIEDNSKSLWIRLTASSEFQKGIQVVKYTMIAIALLGACVMRVLRHRKKWAKV
jgi:hypothetical protein